MAQLPKPVRAYIGLWARAVSEARDIPRRVAEIPVLAASTTARATLRMGQQYAELVNRGDDVLSRMHGAPEQPPPWATFDDEVDDELDDDLTAGDSETVRPAPAHSELTVKSLRAPRGRTPSAFDRVLDDELDSGIDPDER